jgi:hypothetical protein
MSTFSRIVAMMTPCMIALALVSAPAPGARAASIFDVPFSDRAPAWDAARDVVTVAAVGVPDARIERLAPARLSGRRRALERAKAAVHGWADEALAGVQARPELAARIHGAVDAHASVVATRPLVEGGAVVLVELDGAELRSAAAELTGVPWAR